MTITAGMTSSSFDVDIINNMIQDGDKTFTIGIKLIANCFTLPLTIDSNNAMVTINDEEGIFERKYTCVAILYKSNI